MKSLLITLFTLLFLIVCSITMTASSSGNGGSTTNAGSGQYSWEPETVWCFDFLDPQPHLVTQCDRAGGACSDQYCPCAGHVIEM